MYKTLMHICCMLLRKADLSMPAAGHNARSNTCCDNGLNRFGIDTHDAHDAVVVGTLNAKTGPCTESNSGLCTPDPRGRRVFCNHIPKSKMCMDGLMDGWMDGWTDGQMDGWMEEWKTGLSTLSKASTPDRAPSCGQTWS